MKIKIVQLFALLCLMVMVSNNIVAQNDMYASLNVGYNFKLGTQAMLSENSNTSGGVSSVTSIRSIDVNVCKGSNFGGALGYMFTKNIGAELGFSYLMTGNTKAKSDITTAYSGNNTPIETDRSYSAGMLRIVPTLVIVGGLGKVDPYAKLGFLVGHTSMKLNYNYKEGGVVTSEQYKLNGGRALGAYTAVGVKYNIKGRMSIFLDVNMVNISYAPTKCVLVERNVDGVDLLPTMTVKQKEIEFVNSNNYNPGSSSSETEPTRQAFVKMPFSSLGVNTGFVVSF
jgi:outer membrane protein W